MELGEIEAVMNEFPGVKDAAVVLWRDDGWETLAAYITMLEGAQEPDLDKLKSTPDRAPAVLHAANLHNRDEGNAAHSQPQDRPACPASPGEQGDD